MRALSSLLKASSQAPSVWPAGVSGIDRVDAAAIDMPGNKIIAPRVKRDDIVDPSFRTALNNLIGAL
jgi:hypothetical protein